jgi:hypothetical protein
MGTAANCNIPQGNRWLSVKLGAELFAAVRSVVGTATPHGSDVYQAIHAILSGASVFQAG